MDADIGVSSVVGWEIRTLPPYGAGRRCILSTEADWEQHVVEEIRFAADRRLCERGVGGPIEVIRKLIVR